MSPGRNKGYWLETGRGSRGEKTEHMNFKWNFFLGDGNTSSLLSKYGNKQKLN